MPLNLLVVVNVQVYPIFTYLTIIHAGRYKSYGTVILPVSNICRYRIFVHFTWKKKISTSCKIKLYVVNPDISENSYNFEYTCMLHIYLKNKQITAFKIKLKLVQKMLIRYQKMNSKLGKTMGVIICHLRVYLWQFSRFWWQLLSKQIMIIWNANKNDINFIHEMPMHDETLYWFDTSKRTVYKVIVLYSNCLLYYHSLVTFNCTFMISLSLKCMY